MANCFSRLEFLVSTNMECVAGAGRAFPFVARNTPLGSGGKGAGPYLRCFQYVQFVHRLRRFFAVLAFFMRYGGGAVSSLSASVKERPVNDVEGGLTVTNLDKHGERAEGWPVRPAAQALLRGARVLHAVRRRGGELLERLREGAAGEPGRGRLDRHEP